ncbi:MAG: transglycosylase domain-containing protein, partial [Hyphomicrobiaceae bacterium]|nr:transglycosylase domain-containing protein [Hyphomicrobiaceae bacterium]
MSVRQFGRSSALGRFIGFAAFTLFTLIITTSIFALWFDRNYSDDLRATLHHKAPIITVLSADGHVLAKRGVHSGDISLDELPHSLIDAVIATEDRRFFSHYGIDPRGFLRAVWNNIAKGRLRQGGSTITQQLVKNIFLTRKRTMTRKFRELVIAFWLEAHYSKQQILEHYFNRVYFGSGGKHGIEAAAQYFFNTSAKNLDLPQSALLAGLLKAPSYYSPRKNLARSRARTAIVLDNMLANQRLTIEQAQQAYDKP